MITREEALAYFDKDHVPPADWMIDVVMAMELPDGYSIAPREWYSDLANDVSTMTCDWLNWFVSRYGNVASEAVANLARKAVPHA